MQRPVKAALFVFSVSGWLSCSAQAIEIHFEYGSSESWFTTEKRERLAEAAAAWEGILADELASPIDSTCGYNITNATDPDTFSNPLRFNRGLVTANRIVVYIGHKQINGLAFAEAGPIDATPQDSSDDCVTAISLRGQAGMVDGPDANEFAPIGGTISFDTDPSPFNNNFSTWHDGPEAPTDVNAVDFYTVALHELGHVLGFGKDDRFGRGNAYQRWVMGEPKAFHGPAAMASNNDEPVPLNAAGDHFDTIQALMMSGFSPGERLEISEVDKAALTDMGWTVVEPAPINAPMPPRIVID